MWIVFIVLIHFTLFSQRKWENQTVKLCLQSVVCCCFRKPKQCWSKLMLEYFDIKKLAQDEVEYGFSITKQHRSQLFELLLWQVFFLYVLLAPLYPRGDNSFSDIIVWFSSCLFESFDTVGLLQPSSPVRSEERISCDSGGLTADIDHDDIQSSSSAIDCIEIISPTHWRSFDTPVSSLQLISVLFHFKLEYYYDHNNKAVVQVAWNS